MIGLAMKQLDWTQDEFEARRSLLGRAPREQSALNENTA